MLINEPMNLSSINGTSFDFPAGSILTLNGTNTINPPMTNAGQVDTYSSNSWESDVDNHGTINFYRTNSAIQGQLTTFTGSLINIQGTTTQSAALTLASGFTNHGTIRLQENGYSSYYGVKSASLSLGGNELINATDGLIESVGTHGARYLTCKLPTRAQ